MIIDSAVHAYGRVARAEQLLLPVLLAYVLLPGLRYIASEIHHLGILRQDSSVVSQDPL